MLRRDLAICRTRQLLNEFMVPIVAEADPVLSKDKDIQFLCGLYHRVKDILDFELMFL
ncbi:MAG: hypothetical protein ACYSTF_01090 [Planctomycetota bacterium]|jgi:hypothetical protein